MAIVEPLSPTSEGRRRLVSVEQPPTDTRLKTVPRGGTERPEPTRVVTVAPKTTPAKTAPPQTLPPVTANTTAAPTRPPATLPPQTTQPKAPVLAPPKPRKAKPAPAAKLIAGRKRR